MKQPHIDDFESVEEYEDANEKFSDYCDAKIEESKEEGISLINENTLTELKRLNKEIEGDFKDGN